MPGNTTRDKLRFPVGTDAPNVPLDIQNLATDVENLRAFVLSRDVKEIGQLNNTKAGRVFTLNDFIVNLGLSNPVGLFNLGSGGTLTANLGSGGALTNKGTIPPGVGVTGNAGEAAVYSGSTSQSLFISDTGAADPFRLRTFSAGAWMRTAKKATAQTIIGKCINTSGNDGFTLNVNTVATFGLGTNAASVWNVNGVTTISDDHWHFVVGTYDGIVARLYVDGVLEGSLSIATPLYTTSAAPLNVGSLRGDGATACVNPFYGRIDEAFITQDVLTDEDIRFLMCVKIAHGFAPGALSRTVKKAAMTVSRRQRGAALVAADFPTPPLHGYTFQGGSVADYGSLATALVGNQGTGSVTRVSGPDGLADNAFFFTGAHLGESATDAGLPTGTAARTYGCWFRANHLTGAGQAIMSWGKVSTLNYTVIYYNNGLIDWCGQGTGGYAADGKWHFLTLVEDPSAADGMRIKGYMDGRLVLSNTAVPVTVVLNGANSFRVGALADGTLPLQNGAITRPFVLDVPMTMEQIQVLYQKASRPRGISPKDGGENIDEVDDTNIYLLADTLQPQDQITLEVAA